MGGDRPADGLPPLAQRARQTPGLGVAAKPSGDENDAGQDLVEGPARHDQHGNSGGFEGRNRAFAVAALRRGEHEVRAQRRDPFRAHLEAADARERASLGG